MSNKILPIFTSKIYNPKRYNTVSNINESTINSQDSISKFNNISKEASDAISANFYLNSKIQKILSIKTKANFLVSDVSVKQKYYDAKALYEKHLNSDTDIEFDDYNNISKIYSEKYNKNGSIKKIYICEYEDSILTREDIVPSNDKKTTVIVERTERGYKKYAFLKGKLRQYETVTFNNGEKMTEQFNFNVNNNHLESYIENVYKPNTNENIIKLKIEFND